MRLPLAHFHLRVAATHVIIVLESALIRAEQLEKLGGRNWQLVSQQLLQLIGGIEEAIGLIG